jgi:hypothetical protein
VDHLSEHIAFKDREGLAWVDLPQFVAEHNWPDPAGAFRLAMALDHLIRACLEHPALPFRRSLEAS